MIKHQKNYYSKTIIDENHHIPKGEDILGEFMDRKKTPWKAWGNKITNSLIITNNYVIYTYLIKWYSWPANNGSSQYVVDRIPINSIEKASHHRKPQGKDELELEYVDENGRHFIYKIELQNKVPIAISLINSSRKK